MAKILITSGPTRQYLDPVRYLSNASSGRMGAALAQAALDQGHQVILVSGPVSIEYPSQATVIPVVSTDDMLRESSRWFPQCDGMIGAAAPCDYMPKFIEAEKIAKTGQPLQLQLIETPDVVATLGQAKQPHQWVVGFALESEDRHFRAIVKLEKKHCDLIVSNGPAAIDAERNEVELIDPSGAIVTKITDTKEAVAQHLMAEIQRRLIDQTVPPHRASNL